MDVLKRYRMLAIVYVITLVFGTREFLISRAGGTVDWISTCESAAGCSSTQQSSAPTDARVIHEIGALGGGRIRTLPGHGVGIPYGLKGSC